MGWDARVAWTLLVFGSMMAARFAPSLAIDVPDEALLDLDRLAVTAWSARDAQRQGRRGRIVVAADAMERLVHRASRIVTGASAAILVTVVVASPLLLRSATIDLDRIGARCLVFFAGCSLLLAARSYRHAAARALLRLAGLAALVSLAVHLVGGPGASHLDTVLLRRGRAGRDRARRGRRHGTRLALGLVVPSGRGRGVAVRQPRLRLGGRRGRRLPPPVGNDLVMFSPNPVG